MARCSTGRTSSGRSGSCGGWPMPIDERLSPLRTGNGEPRLGGRNEIVAIAGPGDRPHRRRVDEAVDHKTLVDVDADDLAEHQEIAALPSPERPERHRLKPLAFEGSGASATLGGRTRRDATWV